MKYKQGFTLIELILVLVVISGLSVIAVKNYLKSEFIEATLELQSTLNDKAKNNLNDRINGDILSAAYIFSTHDSNATGCTNLYGTFDGLSAARLAQCMGWDEESTPYEIIDGKLKGFGLMHNYGGCKLEFRANPSNNQEFDILVDCSDVEEFANDKQMYLLEESIIASLSKNAEGFSINVNPAGNTIGSASVTFTGRLIPFPNDDADGIVSARFK